MILNYVLLFGVSEANGFVVELDVPPGTSLLDLGGELARIREQLDRTVDGWMDESSAREQCMLTL